MSEILTLLSLELRSSFGINKLLHTKDKKKKVRGFVICAVWIYLLGMIAVYEGTLVYGLCTAGLKDIAPAYLVMIASLLILVFGIFTAGSRIFGQKGYDLLASMPVKTSSIVFARFLAMYAEDLVLSALIMASGASVYGYLQKPSFWFYLYAVIGTVFIPVIPIVICILVGTVIYAVSSRMKRKSAVQSVLSVLLVLGVMALSFSFEELSGSLGENGLAQLGDTVGRQIKRFYPPALWLSDAMAKQNHLSFLLFVSLSAAVLALTVFTASISFTSIMRRLSSFGARHDYKMGKMQSRGLLKALYLKEAKRYFSSSVYVTNTIIGPIMGAILSVALCIVGTEKIQASIPISVNIASLLPFAISAVFCMMTTTSSSISMEGRQFWIVKALPIPTKTLLDSKILLNLSLMLPFYIIAEAAMVIAVKPSPMELVWLIIIPIAIMLFSTVFGITVNLKTHSFDWEREQTVVKQSLSATLGGFAPFFTSLIFGGAVFLIPDRFGNIAKLCICVLLFAVTAVLYLNNNKTKLEKL